MILRTKAVTAFLLAGVVAATAFSQTGTPAPAASATPGAPSAPPVPAVPLGVAMVANSADSITLAWYRAPNNDAKVYTVYSSATKDGTFTRVADVTERTSTIKKLSPGTTYYFKVAAAYAHGVSAQSPAVQGFTITPVAGADFPVRIARNMCVSLGATLVSSSVPKVGKLSDLVDGSDATSCGIEGATEVKIKLNTTTPIGDAAYLMLNFRSDNSGKGHAYNINWRALKDYVITESHDSTDGSDGTWKEIASGSNKYLDGVVVIPNNKPKWIGVRNSGSFQLCRLDVFRAAPAGFRNDYWIFAGDSLIVQDISGGSPDGQGVKFADLVRQQHPDRYPMVVNSSQGGEVIANTLARLKNSLPVQAAPNGTAVPTGTILCLETGFNDIGVGGGLWMGPKFIQSLTEAQELCKSHGIFLVPVRIEYSNGYLNKETLEPNKYNVFYNTLAVNLAGVDVFARTHAPYACDPKTQMPYADYWTYTRENHATALAKDGVHHTKEGSDGINRLWASVADKMIYAKQR
ncbi:MAG: fibronectin type III domain-containing protein [Rariglobus sp.]|nr:fibronectin type III domain-containing protein [Rariglobus sp.]